MKWYQLSRLRTHRNLLLAPATDGEILASGFSSAATARNMMTNRCEEKLQLSFSLREKLVVSFLWNTGWNESNSIGWTSATPYAVSSQLQLCCIDFAYCVHDGGSFLHCNRNMMTQLVMRNTVTINPSKQAVKITKPVAWCAPTNESMAWWRTGWWMLWNHSTTICCVAYM